MGDYVDWDYSESIGGVPTSLIAYSATAARKRRGAIQGFDTAYTSSSDATIAGLTSRIDKLTTQLTQLQTLQGQYLATQGINYIVNGDFSQWSTVYPMRSTTGTLNGVDQTWKIGGTCIPCADRWYTMGEINAFMGLDFNTRLELTVRNVTINKSLPLAALINSKRCLELDYNITSTGTPSLYNGGDNRDKSSAVLGLQHLVQNVALWQNRKLTLDFWASTGNTVSAIPSTIFVQVCRQYNLDRSTTVDTSSMRGFSNSLKPPGLEVIFRDQITIIGTGWQRIQRTFELGALLNTPWGPTGEHGLLIQIGPLYYINTKDSAGNTVIQQWGNAGGANGLFRTNGNISFFLADVLMYDGPVNGTTTFPLRDESVLTLPWVSTYGPRFSSQFSNPNGYRMIGNGAPKANALRCRLKHIVPMARGVSNVIIGNNANRMLAYITADNFWGSKGPDKTVLLSGDYSGTTLGYNSRARIQYNLQGLIVEAFSLKSDGSTFNGVYDMNDNSSSSALSLMDANESETTVALAAIITNQSTVLPGSLIHMSVWSTSPWFAMYVRDTDWGATVPIDSLNLFDYNNSAVTTIPFPLSTIN